MFVKFADSLLILKLVFVSRRSTHFIQYYYLVTIGWFNEYRIYELYRNVEYNNKRKKQKSFRINYRDF
jgi:hypothetical protein